MYLVILMMWTVPLFVPLVLVRLTGGREASERFTRILTGAWARHLLWFGGVRVEVERRGPPVPGNEVLCVVSNHQGDADILLAVGFVPRLVGFIAKRELKKLYNWKLYKNGFKVWKNRYKRRQNNFSVKSIKSR